ncbi:ankyrin repeat domain-containing protein 16, partial [Eurytemora carolleeae]|uniref:ankyrin repeat domain-containing protein 16 n=1 Tax=Eurytemora carolleeae TaxID=1294199 RepID=UPI000C78839C
EGFGLDVKTRDGQSALHCAAREGQLVTVNFILGQGGLVNLRDVNGRTSLFLAISGQHVETCKSLLEAGAELFTDKSYLNLEELARKPELKRLINLTSALYSQYNKEVKNLNILGVDIDAQLISRAQASSSPGLVFQCLDIMDESAPARIKEFLKESGRDKFHIIFVFRRKV